MEDLRGGERAGKARDDGRWTNGQQISGPVKIREPKSRVISVNRRSRRSLDPRQADRQITGAPELRRRSSVISFHSSLEKAIKTHYSRS